MKVKFLIAALFFSLVAAAQPSNYIKFNTRGRWIAGMFDSTLHVPRFNGSPSLRTGGSSMDGAIAIDTTNGIFYFYQGGSWKRANLDTSAYAVTSVYRKTASDSVFYVKGGVHTFAYKDSTGGGSSGVYDSLKYVSVINYGADPTGTSGSAAAFLAAVATGKAVYVPPGRYKIEGVDSIITLQANQTIFGAGAESELFTTTNGATTNLTTAMNFLILSNGGNTVRDLKFTGNGKTTYTFPWTSQNGVWVYSSRNTITNCTFKNLRGAGILGVHPSLTTHYYNSASHNKIDSSTIGVFTYAGSEYWTFTDITATNGTLGANEWGANNNYVGCHFIYNTTGASIQGTGGNSDHSYFTSCVFNHNSAKNLDIDNIVNSITFTGGGVWSSPSTVDQSVGVSFSNFQFGTIADLTVTASSTDKTTYLYNCFKATTGAPTFTESGTGKIMEVGTFNSGVNSFAVNKPVIFSGLPAGVGTKAVRIDGSGNLTTADTTAGGSTDTTSLSARIDTKWTINGNVGGADGKWIGHSDNYDFNIRTNNTNRLQILKTGEIGIGTTGFTGYKMVIYSTGTTSSTYHSLFRNLGGENLWSLRDDGSTVQGKNTTSQHNFNGKTFLGGTTTPTALLHIAAPSATANTGQIKLVSGTPPTTPETGLINFQNGLLLLDSSTSVRDTIATREWAQSQFYSGTQTPTATNSTNVSASTPGQEQYMRVGNTVTVSGYIEIDCTSASVTSEIDLSLPVPSAFSSTTQLSGVFMEAISGVASPGHGTISSNSTNDRVSIIFTPRADTNLSYRYTYTYQVL